MAINEKKTVNYADTIFFFTYELYKIVLRYHVTQNNGLEVFIA